MAFEAPRVDVRFERGIDYRKYRITDTDRPLVTVAVAAERMGVTAETVRRRIRDGLLPAFREHDEYNPRFFVPVWAVEGWVATDPIRLPHDVSQPQTADTRPDESARRTASSLGESGESPRTVREAELERALFVLRAASEHERRSRQLLEEALAEASRANDLLSEAVGAVIVPDIPPGNQKRR